MTAGTIEIADKDIGKTADKVVQRWLMEIDLASDVEEKWRNRARKVVQTYRDDKTNQKTKFNILWANVSTQRPAMYSATPKPDVRRRWRTKDETGRLIAIGLERALAYSIDEYDFDKEIVRVAMDLLLPGRGVCRVRYIPHVIETPETKATVIKGEEEGSYIALDTQEPTLEHEEIHIDDTGMFVKRGGDSMLDYEQVVCEHWHWEDYRMSPGKSRRDQRWEAFRHLFNREELTEEFGPKGTKCILDDLVSGAPQDYETHGEFYKRAEVWEIWDKEKKQVVYISRGHKDGPLLIIDDPYELTNFWSTPDPIYAVETTDSTIPIPEYTMYQSLALELEKTTRRIDKLIDALRVRGVYDATITELDQLLKSGDNKLIPVQSWARLMERGGLDGVVNWMPIDQIAKALAGLYNQRDQLLQTIFQIMGIADIVRGSTDPNETLGAQKLKGQFSGLRQQPRQRQIETLVKQTFEIKAEIIAKRFKVETLSKMTGEEITPEMLTLLRDDDMRKFRIDVETDSTIAADAAQDKQDIIEFITAMVEMIKAITDSGIPPEAGMAMVMFAARRFKISRELEESLEQAFGLNELDDPNAEKEPEPDPEAEQAAQDEAVAQQQDQQNREDDMAKHRDEMMIQGEELGLKREEMENKRVGEIMKLMVARVQAQQKPTVQ